MANTYTQLHIQVIFAVRYRQALIDRQWQEPLHQYITGIVQQNDHKMLQINSMADHVHMLIGLRPMQSLSSLVQNVKTETSKWINDHKLCRRRFGWQEGYGAFSYAKSQLPKVISYIQNQQTHHKKWSFQQEYRRLLEAFEVEFDERYIFKEPE